MGQLALSVQPSIVCKRILNDMGNERRSISTFKGMYLRGEGGWCPPFPLLLFSWETHFYLPLQISTPIYALLILSSPHLHDLYFPYLYFVYKVTMLGMTCTIDYLYMHTLLFWLIIIESFI